MSAEKGTEGFQIDFTTDFTSLSVAAPALRAHMRGMLLFGVLLVHTATIEAFAHKERRD